MILVLNNLFVCGFVFGYCFCLLFVAIMSSADTAGKGVNKSGGKAKTDSGSSRTRSDKPPSCRRSINLPVPVLKTGEDYGMWKRVLEHS